MDVPKCNSISSDIDANWLTQAENGVSRKGPSKTRRSFLNSLQIKPCGMRCKSRNKFSIQNGNATAHLLRYSLFRIVSTLVMLLETEASSFCCHVAYKICGVTMV